MQNSQKEVIAKWLQEDNGKPKLILVYWPTASGKSRLAVEIGIFLKETTDYSPFVISVDARQLYRGLDIWTGKIQVDEMAWIPHKMIDIIDPSERFSVVDFKEWVTWLPEWKEWENGGWTIPLLCGGTGLYIDSLIFKRSYPAIEADWERRDELEAFRKEHGNEALWKLLDDIDPRYAAELHPNNFHYVMRGIEVMEKIGKSKLDIVDSPELIYDVLFLTPYEDTGRENLYARINQRVEKMFDDWLIEEVWYNMSVFSSSAPGLKTIGYKEVVAYLEWEITLETCKDLVKQHNRNYAKRQITWNKKYDESRQHPW